MRRPRCARVAAPTPPIVRALRKPSDLDQDLSRRSIVSFSLTTIQVGTLNTSTPGTFSFIVSAVDDAGNTSQASISYTVKAKVDTALSLSSSPNPSKPNQDVILTATVSALAPDSDVPAGLVEFRVNGAVVGSAPLVNGVASVRVTFKKGSYSLTAASVGGANFNGSSGSALHKT